MAVTVCAAARSDQRPFRDEVSAAGAGPKRRDSEPRAFEPDDSQRPQAVRGWWLRPQADDEAEIAMPRLEKMRGTIRPWQAAQ